MNKQPLVSVIIPAYNAGQYLDRCISAISASSYSNYEIIVVDDSSTDNSADIARMKNVKLFQLPRQSGPAAARNLGAQKAQGDILFFVDSDVIVQQSTVERVVADLQEHPEIAALFGSYDDTPAEKNFLSQYKNLYHHFVHQQSSNNAVTFWAGCGAIRREVFQKACGFDHTRYTRPSIEDIELGCRMSRMGYKILLDKELQVKHLKQWTLKSLICTDIFYRAIPWSRLTLESREVVNTLNLQTSQRISACLVGLSIMLAPFLLLEPRLFFLILLFVGGVFFLNHNLYGFFLNHRGPKFAALAFPLQLFYYFYSGVTFVLCWSIHLLRKLMPLH